jgi:hypothetical protein
MHKHLTEWYPPEIKPVRVGAYRTEMVGFEIMDDMFSWWNGKFWSNSYESLMELTKTIERNPEDEGEQCKRWQGMTENRYPDDGTK